MTTQLDTLREFPFTIQWRKEWEATTQYIKNDAVISPTDKSVYILIITSELGGDDPVTNLNWFPITSPTSGVTNIEARDGIKNTGTGTNAILENTGILTVRSGNNVSITGTAINPIINATLPNPRLCKLFDGATATLSGFPINSSSAGVMTFGASLSSLFNDYLLNGAPDPNGTFYIDITSIAAIVANGPIGPIIPPNDFMTIGVRDTTANITIPIGFQKFWTGNTYIYPLSFNFGTMKLNVASVRSGGITVVDAFVFTRPSGFLLNINFSSAGIINAIYSPTG